MAVSKDPDDYRDRRPLASMRGAHRMMILLPLTAAGSGLLTWAAADAPCQSGFDECEWNTWQDLALVSWLVTLGVLVVTFVVILREVFCGDGSSKSRPK